MNDLTRIFLICCCMVLSFKLGKEYAYRIGVKRMLDGLNQAMQQLKKAVEQATTEAPSPNETLGRDFWQE